MGFYGRSNRLLVEQELNKGELTDSEIAECDLSGLIIEKVLWNHTDMRDLHANDIEFRKTDFQNSTFFRSSLMRGQFLSSNFTNMTMDGLTLIKSQWLNCVLAHTTLKNNCLQRAVFKNTHLYSL